ncbi:MAG TPA: zinc ribbon domain-containing protein [Candidatus Limnocylindria bacterium]|jgi:hypothetical protein|nr:zinc ribbon domain-containing protein [Candidatus Limnocylindria bacterium]
MAAADAASATARAPTAAHRIWLQIGSVAAFVAAAGALVAAAAGGITEPTGIATIVAVVSTVIAYGLAPLAITVAMRQSALSSWWAVAAALVAAALWSAAGVVFAMPALYATAPSLIGAFVSTAPSASALWVLVASVEAVRAGMHRWSLVALGAFVAVLIVGSVLIELSGFDIRKVLVPLGWAVWMVDVGLAVRARLSPAVAAARPSAPLAEPCANCGTPRRTDGFSFCGNCGLPYGTQRT